MKNLPEEFLTTETEKKLLILLLLSKVIIPTSLRLHQSYIQVHLKWDCFTKQYSNTSKRDSSTTAIRKPDATVMTKIIFWLFKYLASELSSKSTKKSLNSNYAK